MKKILVSILSLTLCMIISVPVFASEINSSGIKMTYSNDKISISLPDNVSVEFTEYNQVILKDKLTGKSEALPTYAFDAEKNLLDLSYVKTNTGIDVYATSMARLNWWDAVKCAAGTVGSAGGGFLAGAGVGTVSLPIVGTVSGSVLGAYSGGLVGIASFC